jgi:hypothetical protein
VKAEEKCCNKSLIMESKRCSIFVQEIIKNVEGTDTSIDGRIILKWIFKKWDGGHGWIDLAQDRDK